MANQSTKTLGKGYVHVYTGNGKGKTTAALGLAFRAIGHGLKVYIGQFMKGQHYGELETARLLPGLITIEQYGKNTFIHVRQPADPEDVRMARKGLRKAKAAMLSSRYNIIIVDEITTAYHFHLITLKDMLDLVKEKPDGVELIYTGRYAPKKLINAADIVTDMTEIKHYYQKKVIARDGIER
jgi:cob(I)alamin adenosyltransferase